MTPSKPVASFRELKLKVRWVEDDEGTKFAGYNVVSGSITMDEPDEIYHVIEYSAYQHLRDENELLRAKLNKALLDEKCFLENAPLESGVCCCGSTDCSSIVDGHSFVDSGGYAIMNRIKAIESQLQSETQRGEL